MYIEGLYRPARTHVLLLSSARDGARALFQPCPHRHVFQKAAEYGLASFGRGGHDHPVGFQATQFARSEIHNNNDLATDECFWGVGFGNSCNDLASLGTEVDFEAE